MNNPLLTAVKHRRQQHLDMDVLGKMPAEDVDDSKLSGQPGSAQPSGFSKKAPTEQGDLAPEADESGDESQLDMHSEKNVHKAVAGDKASPLRAPARNKLMVDVQDHMRGNELQNPEHEPVPRGNGVSELGNEQSGSDSDFEKMIQAGHEGDAMDKRPRTLGARVRASLQKKVNY